MFDWDEFEHLHVVRKLKEILSQWWNVEIFFADDRGFLRNLEKGEEKTFKNAVLNLVLNTEKGFDSLTELSKLMNNDIRKEDKKHITMQWDIGVSATACPIYVSDEYMGMVIATGAFQEGEASKQKALLSKKLKEMGFSSGDSEEAVSAIKSISPAEESYFTELV